MDHIPFACGIGLHIFLSIQRVRLVYILSEIVSLQEQSGLGLDLRHILLAKWVGIIYKCCKSTTKNMPMEVLSPNFSLHVGIVVQTQSKKSFEQ